MYGYILNSMPSPWFSWIVLSTSVIATRPLRSIPSSVLLAKTSLLNVPLESLPKSAPSPFAIIRLWEMVTGEFPRTPSTPFATVSPLTTLPPARDPIQHGVARAAGGAATGVRHVPADNGLGDVRRVTGGLVPGGEGERLVLPQTPPV